MESDDEVDFVALGTPLEPIEEDEVARKKPVAIQDQIVTDEQGRRRFHGAFTGGFSAGYYNTVGSKEGWTPSTFKSSRKDRKEVSSQSVQDFMDEEDIGAFGIAPQRIRPTEDFTSKKRENLKRPRPSQSSGPIPGDPVLFKIIQPVVETMGVKVLRKMGWRPGQGVGPKFRKKVKRKDKPALREKTPEPELQDDGEGVRRYGCELPPGQGGEGASSESDSSDEENIPRSLIAPDDVNSPLYNPKENRFGLGYKGLDRNALFSGGVDLLGPSLKFRVENRKMDIAGEAFGIGVFEDADEEVYSREDMSQYDFALETPEERKRRLKGESRERQKKGAAGSAFPGFVPAKHAPLPPKQYPPPHIPSGFVPVHAGKKSRFSQPERSEESKEDDVKRQGLQRHQLSRDERRVLLEEPKAPEPQPPRSAISFTSSGIQDSGKDVACLIVPETPSKPAVEEENTARMERLKKFTEILQAYSSRKPQPSQDAFKPFVKHPGKQERYEKYLTLKSAGFSECLKDLQPPEMTEWERERERVEFERASALYKPLSGEMSSRFVTAKSHDISHIVPEREKEKEKDPTQDPKIAAKMNLFGKLTHKVEEWHPDRLVCKRFNVPHPYPNSKMVGVRKFIEPTQTAPEPVKDITLVESPPKKSLFADLDFSKPPPGLLPPGTEPTSASSVAEPQLEFDKAQATMAETPPDELAPPSKPPMDLFKEIFAESSESEEEEEEEQQPSSAPSNGPTKTIPEPTKSVLTKLSTSPAIASKGTESKGGIFHNIDFSRLAPSKGQSETGVRSDDGLPSVSTATMDNTEEMDQEPIYGPFVPPKPPQKTSVSAASRFPEDKFYSATSSAKEMWVEKNAVESQTKKKKKHKKEHKSQSHKSKKSKKKSSKHKKHKRKSSKASSKSRHKDKRASSSSSDSSGSDSDNSSSSSDSNLPHVSENNRALIEKLRKFI